MKRAWTKAYLLPEYIDFFLLWIRLIFYALFIKTTKKKLSKNHILRIFGLKIVCIHAEILMNKSKNINSTRSQKRDAFGQEISSCHNTIHEPFPMHKIKKFITWANVSSTTN